MLHNLVQTLTQFLIKILIKDDFFKKNRQFHKFLMRKFYIFPQFLLRLALGTAFIIHGYSKFPLPFQKFG